jgi:hypothetical protein
VLRAIGVLRSRTARAAGGGLADALEAIWFERFGFRRDEEPDGEEARQRHASLVTLLGIAERLEPPPGPPVPAPTTAPGARWGWRSSWRR